MLYKVTEWETLSGWHCACVDNLKEDSGAWYMPARVLGITPAQFIELVINEYGADRVSFSKDTCYFHYSWSSQTKMRKFKNMLNKVAREKNFQI